MIRLAGLRDRLTGDPEERSADVRLLHEAMRRAAEAPSPGANARVFALLAEAKLWTIAAGGWPQTDQLIKGAKLSGGNTTLAFRGGSAHESDRFTPTATTSRRLLAARIDQPGDELVRLPFRFLARVAREAEMDALVINPGTTPFVRLSRGAIATFADGLLPRPDAPDRVAVAKKDDVGPIQPMRVEELPADLLNVATRAVRDESAVEAASLVLRSINDARVYMLLVAPRDKVDRKALSERLVAHLIGAVGPESYTVVEFVDCEDPRLRDLSHAAVVHRGDTGNELRTRVRDSTPE
jgi:hypothetical protein